MNYSLISSTGFVNMHLEDLVMDYKLAESPYRLMKIIWANEPMTSMDLAKLAQAELGWKRTTTYSVLKALVVQGFCVNDNTMVTSLVTPEEVERYDSNRIAEYAKSRFGGSLPKFITAFIDNKGMSKEEADEIIEILNKYRSE